MQNPDKLSHIERDSHCDKGLSKNKLRQFLASAILLTILSWGHDSQAEAGAPVPTQANQASAPIAAQLQSVMKGEQLNVNSSGNLETGDDAEAAKWGRKIRFWKSATLWKEARFLPQNEKDLFYCSKAKWRLGICKTSGRARRGDVFILVGTKYVKRLGNVWVVRRPNEAQEYLIQLGIVVPFEPIIF